MMNNELLKLFDIKDDVVDTFTVDNNDSNYEIILDLNLPGYIAPIVAALIFINKGNRKRSLVSVPVNDKPVKMSTYVKDIDVLIVILHFQMLTYFL